MTILVAKLSVSYCSVNRRAPDTPIPAKPIAHPSNSKSTDLHSAPHAPDNKRRRIWVHMGRVVMG